MAKWGSADFTGLKELQEKLLEMEKESDEFYKIAARALAGRLLELTLRNTPVGDYPIASGKNGGTLRRGWVSKTHDEAIGGSGTPTAAQAIKYAQSLPVKKTGDTYTIEVVNPVEYASYVEYGHRTVNGGVVEGQYFLTTAKAIVENEKDGILERQLTRYLKEHLA